MGSATVHVLDHDNAAEAASVIARAFDDDPLNVAMFPDPGARARLAPTLFEALVRYDVLFGQVDYLPGLTAVASWQGPGATPETPEQLAQAGFDDLPGGVPLKSFGAVFDAVTAAVGKMAPEPHWHLRLLAVDPDRQGEGLGTALLQHGLQRAGASGQPVVLETFAPRTVPFYLRNGFEVIVDEVETSYNLRFWVLRHEPKSLPRAEVAAAPRGSEANKAEGQHF